MVQIVSLQAAHPISLSESSAEDYIIQLDVYFVAPRGETSRGCECHVERSDPKQNISQQAIYIYIYIYVCVCVCVCVMF